MSTVKERPSHSALHSDGRPSGPASSSDRVGTGLISERKDEPRYIYYRLFTYNGPLHSNNPVYSNDCFIGRVPSNAIRPPPTAASLKKYICKIEGFKTPGTCDLYLSLSDGTRLEDSTRFSVQGQPGPGLSVLAPMALVVDTRTAEKRLEGVSTVDSWEWPEQHDEQRFVYYRVYDKDGQATSRASFSQDNPFLGRIDIHSIAPPQTVASLKYRLMKVEEISNAHDVQIFEDEAGESIMDDGDALASSDASRGFPEDGPIAITYEPQFRSMSHPVEDRMSKIYDYEESTQADKTHELQASKEEHAQELRGVRSELSQTNEELKREQRNRDAEEPALHTVTGPVKSGRLHTIRSCASNCYMGIDAEKSDGSMPSYAAHTGHPKLQWTITKHGENWRIQSVYNQQYLWMPIETRAVCSSPEPHDFALISTNDLNQFRVTQVDSRRSWNAVVIECRN